MLHKRWTRRRPLFSPPPRKQKARSRIAAILWRMLKRLCFVIGAMVLLSSLLTFCSLTSGKRQSSITLPQKMVLYLPLKDGFSDVPVSPGLTDPFGPVAPSLQTQIEAIDKAAADPRVKGLVAYMQDGNFELVHIEEMRAALKRFKATGKFMTIYADSFGEAGGGLGRFYLASIFEKRWMQPLGIVTIPGIRMEMPFFKDVLDKIGIQPQFFHRKDYKTLFESATNNQMSPQNREMLTKIANDIRTQLVTDIAADLKTQPATFEALVDKGLFTADEALKAGLITDINYDDVLYEQINKDITGDPETKEAIYTDIADYAAHANKTRYVPAQKNAVLIYASGAIMQTSPGGSPFGGENVIAADDLAPLLLDLADDKTLDAIILRIDSPGGSPGASENILRAVDKARQKGKKVIISMGATTASGGYWIASGADYIFALPSTLTGSIGVAGGKVSAAGLWNKAGVNWDSVTWGKNATLWSMNQPFTTSEAERINAMMDQVYNAFTARVAKGRKMAPQKVEDVSRGRVWTGQAAKENGLVDELGGLNEALDYTARALGAKDQSGINIEILPKPLTPWEELMNLVSGGTSYTAQGTGLHAMLLQFLKPLSESLNVLMSGEVYAYEPLKIR